MPTVTQEQLTINKTTLNQGETGCWILKYDPVAQRVIHIEYFTSTEHKTAWSIVTATTILGLLSIPAVAGLQKPMEDYNTNLYREAKDNNILDQFVLPQQVYVGAGQVHKPFQLCTEYGAFPSIKYFYQYQVTHPTEGLFDWTKAKDAFNYLLENKKIDEQELNEELTYMLNNGIITQNQFDEL